MLLNDILQLVVLLDNYTTIGPSDRDTNLKKYFYLFNIQYIHSEKKIEEI